MVQLKFYSWCMCLNYSSLCPRNDFQTRSRWMKNLLLVLDLVGKYFNLYFRWKFSSGFLPLSREKHLRMRSIIVLLILNAYNFDVFNCIAIGSISWNNYCIILSWGGKNKNKVKQTEIVIMLGSSKCKLFLTMWWFLKIFYVYYPLFKRKFHFM